MNEEGKFSRYRNLIHEPKKVSIPYYQYSIGLFISLLVSYFQVCSSAFIESPWIVSPYDHDTSVISYLQLDRPVLSRHFQILNMIRNESNQAFSTRLSSFNNATVLTAFALFRSLFETEVTRIIKTFIRLLPVDFQRNVWYNMEILSTLPCYRISWMRIDYSSLVTNQMVIL
jgi:hypothetical protein